MEVLEILRLTENIAPPVHANFLKIKTSSLYMISFLWLGSDCVDVQVKPRILCSYMALPTFSC